MSPMPNLDKLSKSSPAASLIGWGTNGRAAKRTSFKQRKSLEMRKEEMKNIRTSHPLKIPVIVEKYYKEVQLPPLEKEKYLVPPEISMSQFVAVIRNRMNLSPTQTLYLIVNNKSLANMSKTMAEIYREERDEDGFLYMVYASQEMFG
ncbi:microtubule-associated proteins 1A/1B light chain 3A-like [Paramacrobiotus metropolitanus]|uniref:microtubule-associated proteins 1A/1B light chain 3A-like n=1 Tax=Paramacrobiotus metropolitanus TaxID=2943436 RepID=UPI0024458CEF|nr:microtubule-associated proteins 1A/1B light chain 3A-like [Paramacrobiotus metropolitanus]